ncbi:MAG: GNAT family N-acetyltransferase [Lachnospiraceae bacterium]|nr:GNAT family N-acetyltransferase [Lachnospiraceae bacterium]
MQIVMATQQDKDEILKLYKAQLGREFCPWTEGYPGEETIDIDLAKDALFVMKDDDRIVSAISIEEDKDAERLECWDKDLAPGGELARLAVLPEMQNRGLARQMLGHGMKILKERGFRSIHFLVNKHNIKAIASYAVFGFAIVGECHMYEQDFLCYEKALD